MMGTTTIPDRDYCDPDHDDPATAMQRHKWRETSIGRYECSRCLVASDDTDNVWVEYG